jgi:subtilisin family serine protease
MPACIVRPLASRLASDPLFPGRHSRRFPRFTRFLLGLGAALALAAGAPPSAEAFVGVTPELAVRAEKVAAGELIRVNVILWAQHDTAALARDVSGLRGMTRRQALWNAVEARVHETQAPMRAVLAELEARGEARAPRTLFSANGVNVWLTPAGIQALSAEPTVRSLDWDEDRPVEEVIDVGPLSSAPAPIGGIPGSLRSAVTDTSWNVERVRAPQVWGLGHRGQGMLIGVIDTGVNYHHQDLADHMWDGGAEYPHHGYDFVDDDNDPIDEGHSGGHGTSVAGLCCGDGTAGTATGVAPDATVMAIRCSGNTSSEAVIWMGEDFALARGCDVITMSLSWKLNFNPDYATWRAQEDMIHAADVAHSQSAGNQNQDPCCPTPWNVSTPGNSPGPWRHPHQTLDGGLSGVTAVANVDVNDVVASTSSHGPSSWETVPSYGDYPYDPEMGLLKPDIAAPGSNSVSLRWNDNQGYSLFGGTSGAAPHVGGAYCILREANAALSVADLSRIVQLSAVDRGDPGKDNRYGAGRLDVLAAYQLGAPSALAPPTDLTAADTPQDLGGSIDLAWTRSPDDGGGNGAVDYYEILRATSPNGYLDPPVGIVPAGTESFQDTTAVNFVPYYYVVVAAGAALRSPPSNEAGPVVAEPTEVLAVDSGASPVPEPFLAVLGANPFSRDVALRFGFQAPATVELAIYSVTGDIVRRLVYGPIESGVHQVTWDGRDARGRPAPGGVYVAALSSRDLRLRQKLVKLR